jgi:hypothetical protein
MKTMNVRSTKLCWTLDHGCGIARAETSSWAATESQLLIKAVVQYDLPVFLVSALAIPQPWSSGAARSSAGHWTTAAE